MHAFRSFAGAWLAGLLLSVVTATNVVAAADAEDYRLTDAGLDRYERVTEAMYRYARQHPDAMKALERQQDLDEDADAQKMARYMDEHAPGLRDAMEDAGMSVEEYFTFSLTLAANALAAAFAEHYGSDTGNAQLTAVQRDNLSFAQRNTARFQAFSERLQREYGDLMGDDEESYDEEHDGESYDEYGDQPDEDSEH